MGCVQLCKGASWGPFRRAFGIQWECPLLAVRLGSSVLWFLASYSQLLLVFTANLWESVSLTRVLTSSVIPHYIFGQISKIHLLNDLDYWIVGPILIPCTRSPEPGRGARVSGPNASFFSVRCFRKDFFLICQSNWNKFGLMYRGKVGFAKCSAFKLYRFNFSIPVFFSPTGEMTDRPARGYFIQILDRLSNCQTSYSNIRQATQISNKLSR